MKYFWLTHCAKVISLFPPNVDIFPLFRLSFESTFYLMFAYFAQQSTLFWMKSPLLTPGSAHVSLWWTLPWLRKQSIEGQRRKHVLQTKSPPPPRLCLLQRLSAVAAAKSTANAVAPVAICLPPAASVRSVWLGCEQTNMELLQGPIHVVHIFLPLSSYISLAILQLAVQDLAHPIYTNNYSEPPALKLDTQWP